jgi:acetoin utilization deacetylase AcuC-like enzyme
VDTLPESGTKVHWEPPAFVFEWHENRVFRSGIALESIRGKVRRTLADVMLITDEAMLNHGPGGGHPERPDRLRAIADLLKISPIDGARWTKPALGERQCIERIHDAKYIDQIDSLRGSRAQLDEDTFVSTGSVEAAYMAVGAAVGAVNAVCDSECIGFALVRPPGHHAELDRAMGFCLFNNIAIAASHAIAELGIERVLIVDWDVHHGNGTQHLFEDRRDVLVFNAHQWPLWPGTGALEEIGIGEGCGFTVNCPLPAGFDDAGYVSMFKRVLLPIATSYRPQLVLVSAGFDAHRDDPLGGMNVTEHGFAAMCAIVREIANNHANGRLALTLEGGYDLRGLSQSVHACVTALAGSSVADVDGPIASSAAVIDRLCEFHRRHWPM